MFENEAQREAALVEAKAMELGRDLTESESAEVEGITNDAKDFDRTKRQLRGTNLLKTIGGMGSSGAVQQQRHVDPQRPVRRGRPVPRPRLEAHSESLHGDVGHTSDGFQGPCDHRLCRGRCSDDRGFADHPRATYPLVPASDSHSRPARVLSMAPADRPHRECRHRCQRRTEADQRRHPGPQGRQTQGVTSGPRTAKKAASTDSTAAFAALTSIWPAAGDFECFGPRVGWVWKALHVTDGFKRP
ncbi:hypothetical protein [Arthrobacter sp. SW1]|uniref:hypothetical protein n=1 Tax=Arthrobacter sp. SW1 TaxID=1920889 RepID=UPI0011131EB5|nr:hypothetical protein [Arthrobacter sp. SW1]